jgi:hypothetical protein
VEPPIVNGQPTVALVRPPGRSFARALSGHPERATIDPARAAATCCAWAGPWWSAAWPKVDGGATCLSLLV